MNVGGTTAYKRHHGADTAVFFPNERHGIAPTAHAPRSPPAYLPVSTEAVRFLLPQMHDTTANTERITNGSVTRIIFNLCWRADDAVQSRSCKLRDNFPLA